MAVGYGSRFGSVCRCPNRYARNIVLANMRKPTGTATPIPILLEVESLEKAVEARALGIELGVGTSVA